jgi:hypothetical protein
MTIFERGATIAIVMVAAVTPAFADFAPMLSGASLWLQPGAEVTDPLAEDALEKLRRVAGVYTLAGGGAIEAYHGEDLNEALAVSSTLQEVANPHTYLDYRSRLGHSLYHPGFGQRSTALFESDSMSQSDTRSWIAEQQLDVYRTANTSTLQDRGWVSRTLTGDRGSWHIAGPSAGLGGGGGGIVPEPASVLLFGIGIAGMASCRFFFGS